MKKLIPILVIILSFLAFPATGQDSYRIRLKNGGEFTTLRYWSEGDQIKFYIYGGIVGIQKDLIRKIEKTAPENILYGRSGSDQKTAEISSKTNNRKRERAEGKIDLTYYKEKKLRLAAELARTLDRLREASKKRDSEAKERAKNEMRRVSDEIYALTEEVKEKNNGEVPEGWWEKK